MAQPARKRHPLVRDALITLLVGGLLLLFVALPILLHGQASETYEQNQLRRGHYRPTTSASPGESGSPSASASATPSAAPSASADPAPTPVASP